MPETLTHCECDNTHQSVNTVCRYCWSHGRRRWSDPDVADGIATVDLTSPAEKKFYEQYNVGTARYVVNFHDGVQKHPDGSPFYDIRIFHNRREKNRFVRDLRRQGYEPSEP